MKKILTIAICAMLFASCTIYQYSGRDAAINRRNIQATPTIVDVKADFTKRVSATSDWHRTKEDAMAHARYMAITENKIDIVVDPIYEIQYRAHKARKKYKATMTGFAGTYTNARTPLEDIGTIKQYTREEIENYLLLHQSDLILPYLYQQSTGDVINVHSDHSKGSCRNEKKCETPSVVEQTVPAPAPVAETVSASEDTNKPTATKTVKQKSKGKNKSKKE
ncbi:MAG: hypothetical protein IJ814_00795 [Paludibacteraceae bacterium]|nr:hypothetical protein [Paludibacteraceae bacterium]